MLSAVNGGRCRQDVTDGLQTQYRRSVAAVDCYGQLMTSMPELKLQHTVGKATQARSRRARARHALANVPKVKLWGITSMRTWEGPGEIACYHLSRISHRNLNHAVESNDLDQCKTDTL